MYRNLNIEKIREVFLSVFKKGLLFFGAVVTIQEIITGFLYNIISKIPYLDNTNKINSIMYLILVVGLILIVIYSVYEILKKEAIIDIKAENNPKIIIRIGNYEDNMAKLTNNIKCTDTEAIFVIGINDNIDGNRAQKRGVHKSVIEKFYNDEDKFNLLNIKTQKAFNKVNNTENMFGEIGLVSHDENSKIMFVINSKNGEFENQSIVGPQPTDIIKNVFRKLEEYEVDIVQVPVLSSKNVVSFDKDKIRFTVTIVEIIEEYFKQILNNQNINYDLVLSIREEDLKANFITLGNIVKFIEELKPMYHIQ